MRIHRKKSSIQIQAFSTWSLIIACILAALFLVLSILGIQDFRVLEDSTKQYVLCASAANQMQQGSDTLSTQVQLYTMTGDTMYLNGYFREANETRSRENAVDTLKSAFPGSELLESLEQALQDSQALMEREYYAMRLVADAVGTDEAQLPEAVAAVTLRPEDKSRSAEEKLELAREMVTNDDYRSVKNKISNGVSVCLDGVLTQTRNSQNHASAVFRDLYRKQELGLVLLVLVLLVNSLVMHTMVVKPLVRYNESVRAGTPLPIEGVQELQSLAQTCNAVFEENRETQKIIRHEAEHDGLTDLLNRGSFDRIFPICSQGKSPFALVLVDIDHFKTINDTYGHNTGDEIIKWVAIQLKNVFRSGDYVCRIGGDEFAVIMVDAGEALRGSVEERLRTLCNTIAAHQTSLPPVSISIGAAFSDRQRPESSLFNDADKALYYVKEHGKNDYRIF